MNDSFPGEEESIIAWLLGKDDPSVRYFTLTKLLGKGADDAEAVAARKAIMKKGAVPEILALQGEDGAWGSPASFYTDKYAGTVWQLIMLAELGADGSDAGVRRACDFILENSQDKESGAFSMHASAKAGGGRHGDVIPCLTGNMACSLIKLGYGQDERVARSIEWICEYQLADDGDGNPPVAWPYERFDMCWGRHSCHMGVVKSLKALAAIRKDERSGKVEAKIEELAEFLLAHRVHLKSHDLTKVAKPGWLKFGFPLMYQTDALEILCVLKDLDIRDPRMSEALAAVAEKRGGDGRWKMQNSFNGKTLVDVEKRGEASKWITARALYVQGAALA
jgi:hypothetical protein